MNKRFFVVVALAGQLAFGSAWASAQTAAVVPLVLTKPVDIRPASGKASPAGTTRVAVINLGMIFNKYERAAALKVELMESVKKLQEEGKQLTQNIAVWQAALQKSDLAPAKKESYEEKIINAKRRLEDMQRSARSTVGKAQEGSLVVLWKDVQDAVKAYSTEHGIQLVVAYGDPIEAELATAFPNINRKMQALDQGGGVPFFVGPGADITDAVTSLLNTRYRQEKSRTESPMELDD